MILEALRARLKELETAGDRALPSAAVAVRDKLRADVTAGCRAAQKRRKSERALRRASGDKRRVKMGRNTSGVAIATKVVGSAVVVTASSQVHKVARDQTEPTDWMQIFGDEIREAAAPGGKR